MIKSLCNEGATYVEQPTPDNVDVVVLNRHYFQNPDNYDVDLARLAVSLRIRFVSDTKWMSNCLQQKAKVEFCHEIFPPNSGGVIVLESFYQNGILAQKKKTLDPMLIRHITSLVRSEKKEGRKWKILASLEMLSVYGEALSALDDVVEVLKKEKKHNSKVAAVLGVRESHAMGYRHVLLLKKDVGFDDTISDIDRHRLNHVVTCVDTHGLSSFVQTLSANRKSLE